ncbi:T9SS type A sorting domain-containing protein [Adhaeribacter soli]|nr:T9SS type A sorting domain-containing protein [Adhaeribacter soli]
MLTQNANAQSDKPFSKPGKSMNYYHDGTTWIHSSNSTYTYNVAGQELEDYQRDPQTNQNVGRNVSEYDSLGILRSYIEYLWVSGRWHTYKGGRSIPFYSGGKMDSLYGFSWDGYKWNENRTHFLYDSNGLCIQENFYVEDAYIGGWLNISRKNIKYDQNGIITQVQYFGRNYGTYGWDLGKTIDYYAWHVPNISPAIYTSDGGRVTVTLGPNGGDTTWYDDYNPLKGSYEKKVRVINVKDFRGNLTNQKSERYIDSTGQYQLYDEKPSIYTYNDKFDVTQLLMKYQDHSIMGSPIKDGVKYIYSDFQYFNQAPDNTNNQNTKLAFSLYPNPGRDLITVELPENKQEALQVTVSDLSGKARLTRSFTEKEKKQLNIEALPKGIYLLQLKTAQGTSVQKIIKQ